MTQAFWKLTLSLSGAPPFKGTSSFWFIVRPPPLVTGILLFTSGAFIDF